MNPTLIRAHLALLAGLLVLAACAILRAADGAGLPLFAACLTLWGWTAHYRRSAWTGANLFLLTWLVFPLLKIIDRHLIPRHADALLAAIDRHLWGGRILPAYFRYEAHPLLTDLLAACYFSFYAIVLGSVFYYACRRTTPAARRYFNGLIFLYLAGFLGYCLLPAAGPAFTTHPDGGAGGLIAPTLIAIIKGGVTGMDVFPSLHTALTLYITAYLWRDGKRAAALLCAPLTAGTITATIFLRYHYGVDVLAGILLAVLALRGTSARTPRNAA
ncbi:phosphatase PAP2 family protein [uncultured Cardiobacterium sp.]|uniref:phosphatase PAP2 family protein n=1 Tax=uncultured Cardiobacterium sp. TaxID=417619 RepID=UPI002611AFCA|nr:phosphatase PAP2 family protein [uncultured Cardiobacterium sp.]